MSDDLNSIINGSNNNPNMNLQDDQAVPIDTSTIETETNVETVVEVTEEASVALTIEERIVEQNEVVDEIVQTNIDEAYRAINIPFIVDNLSWDALCSICDGFDICDTVELSSNPIDVTQKLIVDTNTIQGQARLLLVSSNITIPVINGYNEISVSCMNSIRDSYAGIVAISKKTIDEKEFGLLCFVPFKDKERKVYGMYEGQHVFSHNFTKAVDRVESISIESDPRHTDEFLTETDKVIIRSKFSKKKLAETWQTLQHAISAIDDVIETTIDPNYIRKMLELNNMLSYPVTPQ